MINFFSLEAFKLRHKLRAWLGPLLIMILVLIAFPLSIDISQYDLNKFYFSVIVVSLLMISFLATESIFSEDYEDGSLEQIHLEEKDFYKITLAKILVHVLFIGIPMALIGSIFSFANGVSLAEAPKIFVILSISTLILFNVFAFGSALSINKGSMLGVVASLPLALPAIVLLGRGVRTVQYGQGFFEVSVLMAGVALIVTALMPIIISATLKTHLE
ncbi:heme exporter protein CcmB [Gammaproteobacteria bacterium]|jgi:heme exporter protein B|nr:heme exporter protein CcmB [Gammaproteobacteria bacterium]MDA9785304.1 heme exporter protein CcmB [Gammaproteobacteria bacterium]MDB0070616.1 heme exporter protein CcmB [Gammaproteobacteria bacterium]MDB2666061.1 heme exporter protein CcmB [Gammaproteobacteria bacterium]MDB9841817.1 heme exporter protein CcmB [Gammaproteobacteria bacterium]|tara:strand:+ start:461 stop:1111 length:651 start_codon:yes stop_codon:yes gene_type:complete